MLLFTDAQLERMFSTDLGAFFNALWAWMV